MNVTESMGPVVYLAIFAAAALEGEVTFISACVLVGKGLLDPLGVAVAGTLGAAAGDQCYFYLLRGSLPPLPQVLSTCRARTRRSDGAGSALRDASHLRDSLLTWPEDRDDGRVRLRRGLGVEIQPRQPGCCQCVGGHSPGPDRMGRRTWLGQFGLAGWSAAIVAAIVIGFVLPDIRRFALAEQAFHRWRN